MYLQSAETDLKLFQGLVHAVHHPDAVAQSSGLEESGLVQLLQDESSKLLVPKRNEEKLHRGTGTQGLRRRTVD